MTDDHEKVDDPATGMGHAFDWGHEEDSECEGTEPDVIRFQLPTSSFGSSGSSADWTTRIICSDLKPF